MVYVVTATSYKNDNQIPVSVFADKNDAEKFLESIFEIAKAATIFECPMTFHSSRLSTLARNEGGFENSPLTHRSNNITDMRHVWAVRDAVTANSASGEKTCNDVLDI